MEAKYLYEDTEKKCIDGKLAEPRDFGRWIEIMKTLHFGGRKAARQGPLTAGRFERNFIRSLEPAEPERKDRVDKDDRPQKRQETNAARRESRRVSVTLHVEYDAYSCSRH